MTQLLQPIAAFVYCNRQVPPAGATRPPAAGGRLKAPLNSAHDDANTFNTQLNSAYFSKNYFISFHDGTTREVK